MDITLHLNEDRYADLRIDAVNRIAIIFSPLPDIAKEQLQDIANNTRFKIFLTITEELIEPDNDFLVDAEPYTTSEILFLMLMVANRIISED